MNVITKIPGVSGGEACIAGTRIAVWMIEGYRLQGLDVDALLKNYPQLTREQLQEAGHYALAHLDEIQEAIKANQEA